ncbi:Aspartyl/glutamyl-tRNA(Asn/Gln) amidotransferase subunit B [Nymphon striatum]|nr:Aspartyl/glutamyl-tRNA(Asn/Gln) amidotransferase subunit B [Nymphon striatum]
MTELIDTRTADPKRFIAGSADDWEVIIGLEVHAQVSSNAKLFSGASTRFGAEPNSNVSLVDAAMPGMLPVINEECVAQAIRTGLGLNAAINLRSVFDRKNYFYPDLPQGYQISQFKDPIVGEGTITISYAGKSMHDQHPTMSFVDLNRTGVALMEIVSKPDIRSSDEAKAYVTKLRSILRYLGTCDGNMSEGSMRADVNVSVRRPGEGFGTRCEIKNMNSIRFIGQAIEYEARRQIAILEDGGSIDQETRLYDPVKGETRSMRSKEDAHDYHAKKARFVSEMGLSPYDASVLVAEKANADYFEKVADGRDGKVAANWVINNLLGKLKEDDTEISDSPISPEQIGSLVDLIKEGTISGQIAKDVFEIVWEEGGDPAQIVEDRGMKQVTDTGAIEAAVDEIIAANPEQVEKAKERPQLAGWFVGQVMKSTGGKANPQAVQALVKQKLGCRIMTEGVVAKLAMSLSTRPCLRVQEILRDTWHATYDDIYGVAKVNEITENWHSMKRLKDMRHTPQSEFLVADNGLHLLIEIENSFIDADTIKLEVEEKNSKAIKFYEAFGFKKVGETQDCGEDGSGIPAIIMEKPIVYADDDEHLHDH